LISGLGVLGDWENPYLTMDFRAEADIVRALAKIVANGHLNRKQARALGEALLAFANEKE
jgi:isoleucyl-tRNA synthetase